MVTARIGAMYVLSSFSLEKVKNNGVNTSDAGSIWVTRNVIISVLPPGSLNREIPYAAGTARQNEIVIAEMAIIKEFLAETSIE